MSNTEIWPQATVDAYTVASTPYLPALNEWLQRVAYHNDRPGKPVLASLIFYRPTRRVDRHPRAKYRFYQSIFRI
jgi:hypothetical protein